MLEFLLAVMVISTLCESRALKVQSLSCPLHSRQSVAHSTVTVREAGVQDPLLKPQYLLGASHSSFL